MKHKNKDKEQTEFELKVFRMKEVSEQIGYLKGISAERKRIEVIIGLKT